MRYAFQSLLVVGAVLVGQLSVAAAPPKPLEIGQPAPNFELPGVDDKTHKLADFNDAKVLVMIFTCNHCPTAQAYEERLKTLHADSKDRGVAIVAISPNSPEAVRLDELGWSDLGDSLEDMKLRAKEVGFEFPYLYDGDTQAVSAAYGVLATPHVFIFDADRKLRYQGRIDNAEIKEPTSHDARNAIESLLAGRPVPVETTRVFGCSTKWADKKKSAESVIKRWDNEPVNLETIDADSIKKLAAGDEKKLRLVNLWATWCGPCVQELPELVTINRMYRGRPFELVTISLDEVDAKDQALEVLKTAHVAAKNYLFDSSDRDQLAETLDPQWKGPVPYTLLIAPGGEVIYRHDGPIDPLEVKRAIVGYLGRTYAGKK